MLTFKEFDVTYQTRFNGRLPLAPLVLPAVYDDVLSYEEHLSKVTYKINELGAYIENQLADVETLIDTQIDARVAEINKRIDAINADIVAINERIDGVESAVAQQIIEVKGYIDAKCMELNDKILDLKAEYNNRIYEFYLQSKQYTDDKVNAERIYRRADIKLINDRFDNFSKEFPLVYCPAHGRYETVEHAIVDCWNSLRVFGLTAGQYDAFEFTCTEFTDLLLTTFEYDVYGGYILKDHINQMFNPFTGQNQNVRDVVTYIADMLKWNGKTAAEYDAYEYTAAEFDGSDYTAFPQDTSKYWTTPTHDIKNKYYKNYVKAYEDLTTQTQGADGFTAEYTGNTKGFVIYMQPTAQSAIEVVELTGVGTYRISSAEGYRDITIISFTEGSFDVDWSENTVSEDPVTTDNTKNIVRAVYRIGGAYDVTELDK